MPIASSTPTVPASVFGSTTNPLDWGITESPCKRRPDTGEPCVRLHLDKMHPSCFKCGPLGKGDDWDPDPTDTKLEPVGANNKQLPLLNCKWPGCPAKTRSKLGYCKDHWGIAHNRTLAWERKGFDGEPTDEWMHRPVNKAKARAGKRKKK